MPITGAGVLLFEDYRPKNTTKSRPVVILCQDTHGLCSDFGGKLDNHSITNCAKRELMEESRNMFRFDEKVIGNLPYYVLNDTYVSFAAKITSSEGIQSKYFPNNKNIIDNQCKIHCWKETEELVRFYIDELTNLDDKGNILAIDTLGNSRVITGRAKACIRAFLKQGILDSKAIVLNVNKCYKPKDISKSFLSGTSCYWI
jgi:hypothetical protein